MDWLERMSGIQFNNHKTLPASSLNNLPALWRRIRSGVSRLGQHVELIHVSSGYGARVSAYTVNMGQLRGCCADTYSITLFLLKHISRLNSLVISPNPDICELSAAPDASSLKSIKESRGCSPELKEIFSELKSNIQ